MRGSHVAQLPAGSPARRSRFSLRSHLLLLVALALVPLLLYSVVTVVLFARERRAMLERGAKERTLALVTAVDTELKRSVAALESLAATHDLEAEKLEDFQVIAIRLLAHRPEWRNMHLTPRSGVQVMNLLRPRDAEALPAVDKGTVDQVLETGKPTVGKLFRERYSGEYVVPVRVPVFLDKNVTGVLTALVKPATIAELLSPQRLPAEWIAVVLDATDTIVARTIDAALVGQPASESLQAALAESDEGWFEGTTIEGWPVYTAYSRSAFSGWTVALGIPAKEVEASLHRWLGWLVGVGVGLVVLGAGLAWLISGRITRSLEDLRVSAEKLAAGNSRAASHDGGALKPASIAEFDELRQTFTGAAELIAKRSEERDRVEASLRHVEHELRESEQRKDQFLAMLGHELRNPLGVVSNAVRLLREVPMSGADAAETRTMVERQVAHMARLLDDLLDVSRIAEGRIQVNRKPCDLREVVREMVADYRTSLESHRITVEAHLPEQPMWVMGDRVRLSQAVGNVLQNADKYTDPGGEVSVHLEEEAASGTAVLTVRDNGVGMEPEILRYAFEPFSQADRTIARSRGGLGLGLALVKGLVELHGGSVSASSEGRGKGTEVTIRLPLEPSAAMAGRAGSAAAPDRRAAGRARRILVIEDNEMAARGLQLYLSWLGHTTEVAHSGQGGIEAALAFRPEVILCDIGLPGLDGFEVARRLRRQHGTRNVYMVAISGYGQEADLRNAREAGFDQHLTKPVDLDVLTRILTELDEV